MLCSGMPLRPPWPTCTLLRPPWQKGAHFAGILCSMFGLGINLRICAWVRFWGQTINQTTNDLTNLGTLFSPHFFLFGFVQGFGLGFGIGLGVYFQETARSTSEPKVVLNSSLNLGLNWTQIRPDLRGQHQPKP